MSDEPYPTLFQILNADIEPLVAADPLTEQLGYRYITVSGSNLGLFYCRVSSRTTISKLKETYSQAVGVPIELMSFSFSEKTIGDEETAGSLKLKNGDNIQVEPNTRRRAKAPKKPGYINTIISDQKKKVYNYQINCKTPLKEIKKLYSFERSYALIYLRFTYGGRQISDEDTPTRLGMKEGAVIRAFLELPQAAPDLRLPEYIKLFVSDMNGDREVFLVLNRKAMKYLKERYAERTGVPIDSIKFFSNEIEIRGNDTTRSLGLKEDDTIQATFPTEHLKQPASYLSGHVNLIVIDKDDKKCFYCIKKESPMVELKSSYADKFGVPVEFITFFFKGIEIEDNDTPKHLGLRDNDVLEGKLEAAQLKELKVASDVVFPGYVRVIVHDKDGKKTTYYCQNQMPVDMLKDSYARKNGVPVESTNLFFNGIRLQDKDTPESLKLKDNDVLRMQPKRTKPVGWVRVIVLGEEAEGLSKSVYCVGIKRKIGDVREHYADLNDIPIESVTFFRSGRTVQDNESIESMGLRDGAVVQAKENESGFGHPIQLPTNKGSEYIVHLLL